MGGAPETNRTSDLPLRRGLLYPLSYRGEVAYSTGNVRDFTGRRQYAYTCTQCPYDRASRPHDF